MSAGTSTSPDAADRYPLAEPDQVDLLRKLALYWDGQWFLNAVEEFGLDAAVRLNRNVRVAFGRIEMRSILKALRKRHADDLADAIRVLNTYLDVFMGGRLKATISQSSPSRATVTVTHCPAFEGAKRAGLSRSDQACVACDALWPVWMSTLLPDHSILVQTVTQLGCNSPRCEFAIHAEPAD